MDLYRVQNTPLQEPSHQPGNIPVAYATRMLPGWFMLPLQARPTRTRPAISRPRGLHANRRYAPEFNSHSESIALKVKGSRFSMNRPLVVVLVLVLDSRACLRGRGRAGGRPVHSANACANAEGGFP